MGTSRASLDEGIRLSPIDPEMFSYRALVRLEQNNTKGAVEDFQEAIRLDPNFGLCPLSLGMAVLISRGRQGQVSY
jgi:lipoprotein NlpI